MCGVVWLCQVFFCGGGDDSATAIRLISESVRPVRLTFVNQDSDGSEPELYAGPAGQASTAAATAETTGGAGVTTVHEALPTMTELEARFARLQKPKSAALGTVETESEPGPGLGPAVQSSAGAAATAAAGAEVGRYEGDPIPTINLVEKEEAPAAAGAGRRRNCEYGARCYRSGQEHLAEFAHQGDADWLDGQTGPAAAAAVAVAAVALDGVAVAGEIKLDDIPDWSGGPTASGLAAVAEADAFEGADWPPPAAAVQAPERQKLSVEIREASGLKVRDPTTTWTITRHEGPNHLGLCALQDVATFMKMDVYCTVSYGEFSTT